MQKRHLIYLGIFFGLCVIGSYVGQYLITSNTPPFILEKFNQLKDNKELMDSIGGFDQYEYSYNKNDFKFGDTVMYSIKIYGDSKVLIYKATQLRTTPTDWKAIKEEIKIDTR